MLKNIVTRVLAFVAYLRGKRAVVASAVALTAAPVLVGGNAAWATSTDPLNGAGTNLAQSLVDNFTTYVIPAVVTIILAVYAFKMIVKLGTRFLNRA